MSPSTPSTDVSSARKPSGIDRGGVSQFSRRRRVMRRGDAAPGQRKTDYHPSTSPELRQPTVARTVPAGPTSSLSAFDHRRSEALPEGRRPSAVDREAAQGRRDEAHRHGPPGLLSGPIYGPTRLRRSSPRRDVHRRGRIPDQATEDKARALVSDRLEAGCRDGELGAAPRPVSVAQPRALLYTRKLLDKHFAEQRTRIPELAGTTLHGLRGTRVIELRNEELTTTQIQDQVGMSLAMIERYCRFADRKASGKASVASLAERRKRASEDA